MPFQFDSVFKLCNITNSYKQTFRAICFIGIISNKYHIVSCKFSCTIPLYTTRSLSTSK